MNTSLDSSIAEVSNVFCRDTDASDENIAHRKQDNWRRMIRAFFENDLGLDFVWLYLLNDFHTSYQGDGKKSAFFTDSDLCQSGRIVQ